MPLDAPVTIATLLDSLLIFTIVLDPTPERPSLLIAGQKCAIALALQLQKVRRTPEPLRLFRREPIPKSDADFLDAFDASTRYGPTL
jgi:hypothetical protein